LPTPSCEQVEPAFAGVWSRLDPNQLFDAEATAGLSAIAPSPAATPAISRDRFVKMFVMADI
jgi:hypothetical protein